MNEGIGRQIFEAVRRATLNLTKSNINAGSSINPNESGGGGSAASGGDSTNYFELKQLLQSKADKMDLDGLNNTKANKLDT